MLSNREHWETLLHTERGSAGLMELFREYTGTLARNMKLTYLNPVGLVTPNIGKCSADIFFPLCWVG